jgi:hypothetical protein
MIHTLIYDTFALAWNMEDTHTLIYTLALEIGFDLGRIMKKLKAGCLGWRLRLTET